MENCIYLSIYRTDYWQFFKVYGEIAVLFPIFKKGNNFCDFLFLTLTTKLFQNGVISHRKEFVTTVADSLPHYVGEL